MVENGLMIGCGIVLIVLGMRTAFGEKQPENMIGALLALVGLGVSLIGTLLICVPDFFS